MGKLLTGYRFQFGIHRNQSCIKLIRKQAFSAIADIRLSILFEILVSEIMLGGERDSFWMFL